MNMMSTREFLQRLDLRQLRYAKSVVEDLIADKEREPMVKIWRVYKDSICIGNYRHNEYDQAIKLLRTEAEKLQNLPPEEVQLETHYCQVFESELEGYLEHPRG